ncbi:MAG: S9 family peptidase [Candidatus Krumholzibacteriota bacterium]
MNRKRDLRAIFVVVLVLLVGLLLGPNRADAMVPEDILTMKHANSGDLSPDGRFLLYRITAWDPDKEENRTTHYRREFSSGRDLLIFTPEDRCRGPVWRPDGQAIAYLRTSDQGTEIWLMDADGASRRRISAGPGKFGDLIWSPDGSALAWIGSAEVDNYEGVPNRYVVADGIDYRHLGQGYREGRLRQLFVMDLANGESRRVIDGAIDVRSCDWSPDSRSLVVEAKARQDLGWNLNSDLWIVARRGGQPRRLTDNPGADRKPIWYRKNAIAYMRATDPLWESAPNEIAVISAKAGDAGKMKIHGSGFDRLFFNYTEAGGKFYVLGANRGCLDLYRLEGDKHEQLTDRRHDFWDVQIAGPRVVLSGAGQTLPGAIFTVDLAEKIKGPHHPRIEIDPNSEWRGKVGLVEPEPFTVEVDGRTIEGWFFKPEDLAAGQKVPVVLSIHGGPEWMYGGYFLPEFHILPRFGYGVVIANPTGSMGYGTEFRVGVRGDWVDRPGREVMACLDRAVAEGWADPEGLAVMGGSYGGFLGAALTTRSQRFKAAALDRMYPDQITFWGTTDEKWFPEWEFMGKPYDPEARKVYLRNSPWEQVEKVRTPTLISQGMLDYRCLIAGGEMWFSALQSRGVPSRFIRFENEGHGIRRPENRVFYYNQLLDWFDEFVLGKNGAGDENVETEINDWDK